MTFTCPSCSRPSGELAHGRCHKCGVYCGCSFDPVSKNDYCTYHFRELTFKSNSSRIFRILTDVTNDESLRHLWTLTEELLKAANAPGADETLAGKAFRLESIREQLAVLRELIGVPTWTTRS